MKTYNYILESVPHYPQIMQYKNDKDIDIFNPDYIWSGFVWNDFSSKFWNNLCDMWTLLTNDFL